MYHVLMSGKNGPQGMTSPGRTILQYMQNYNCIYILMQIIFYENVEHTINNYWMNF